MARLALVYGMRLFPVEDLEELKDATIVLKSGKSARVTMHVLEGELDEIQQQFKQSTEAFFDLYPEI